MNNTPSKFGILQCQTHVKTLYVILLLSNHATGIIPKEGKVGTEVHLVTCLILYMHRYIYVRVHSCPMVTYFSSKQLEESIYIQYFCFFVCGRIFVSIHMHHTIKLHFSFNLL